MNVYLVQHGETVEESVDAQRPLSAKGERDVEALARACRSCRIEAAEVLHSGKLRARQTAEAIARALSLRLREAAGLGPLDPVKPVAHELAGRPEGVILVGHLPFMERLASLLLADRQDPAVVAFQRAGMVCIQRREGGAWCLLWTAFPDQPRP